MRSWAKHVITKLILNYYKFSFSIIFGEQMSRTDDMEKLQFNEQTVVRYY